MSKVGNNGTMLYVADKHPVDEALGCFVPVSMFLGLIITLSFLFML